MRTETRPKSSPGKSATVDAAKRQQTGYGLPCAKCHKYFPADVEFCPVCQAAERVAPVAARKVPSVQPVQSSAKLVQQTEEFSKQLEIPAFASAVAAPVQVYVEGGHVEDRHAKDRHAANRPDQDRRDQDRRRESRESIGTPTPVQTSADPMTNRTAAGQDAKRQSPTFADRAEKIDLSVAPAPLLTAEPQIYAADSSAVGGDAAPLVPNRSRLLDLLTVALGIVVAACAIWLSALVGLRLMSPQSTDPTHQARSAGTAESTAASTTAAQTAAPAEAAAPPATAATAGTSSPAGSSPAASPSEAQAPAAAPGADNRPTDEKQLPSAPSSLRSEKQNKKAGETERSSSRTPPRIFALSPEVAESTLITRVEPEYPDEARSKGLQGAVVLDLHIAKDGTVTGVDVVTGQPVLAEAATAAVKQWRFQPHTINGSRVEMQTRIALRFALPGY